MPRSKVGGRDQAPKRKIGPVDMSTHRAPLDMVLEPQPSQTSEPITTLPPRAEATGVEGRAAVTPDLTNPSTQSKPSPTDINPENPYNPSGKTDSAAAATAAALSEINTSNRQPAERDETPFPPPGPSSNLNTTSTTTLNNKISTLQSQLSTLRAQLSHVHAELREKTRAQSHRSPPSSTPFPEPGSDDAATATAIAVEAQAEAEAEAIVKRHIRLLHDYNEIKDVGLGLMGLIADARGCRLGLVMEEFGVGGKD